MRGALTVLAILLLTSSAYSQDEGEKVIQELRKEKVAMLREIHEQTMAAYHTGSASFSDLAQAALRLQEGVLEAAESKEQRLAAHAEMLKTAEEMVRTAEALYKASKLSIVEVLNSKAMLLDRKIAFEKEKGRP